MDNVHGNYYVPKIGVKQQQAIPPRTKPSPKYNAPAPQAKASANNVAAYFQPIKVPTEDSNFDIQMKKAATLPNGGYVFRNELDGGKAVVKNNKDGTYQVSMIRDSASSPEQVFTLSQEEFIMNPDLCSGFVVPKSDGTYDVTLLNPTTPEERKLLGTNNMKKPQLMKLMKERHFN